MTDLHSYDHIIVFFSGGKDSLAALLHLLDLGADHSRIQLWHHLIDGEADQFMDWPCTPAYCQAIAQHLNLPLHFSWKHGGFRQELLRQDQPTQPMSFSTPYGLIQSGGTRPHYSTRRRWPAVSADLTRRWCSPYLKIQVGAAALRHHPDLQGKRVLTLSGERAAESPSRSRYAVFEPDPADNRSGRKSPRHIDRWRIVHNWSTRQVWEIIERYSLFAHPCYHLGWGRCSCLFCIFGSPNQWASARTIAPAQFDQIASYETELNWTIHREESVIARANRGQPYPYLQGENAGPLMHLALSPTYTWPNGTPGPVTISPWRLPPGAYGEQTGPS